MFLAPSVPIRVPDLNPNPLAGGVSGKDKAGATTVITGGKIIGQEEAIMVGNNSSLTISGGDFTAKDNAVLMGNGADIINVKVEITGGTFHGRIESGGYAACGIFVSSPGTRNISGATFDIVNGIGICVRTGSVVIGDNTYDIEVDPGFTGSQIGDSTHLYTIDEDNKIAGYYSGSSYNHADKDTLVIGGSAIDLTDTPTYYDASGKQIDRKTTA